MLRKIYKELVAIRKELQAINRSLEPSQEAAAYTVVREPYSTAYKRVKRGREVT